MLKVAVPTGTDKHQHPTSKTYGISCQPPWSFHGTDLQDVALCRCNYLVLVIQKLTIQGLEHLQHANQDGITLVFLR
jgi:hypothetical protein